MPLKTTKHRYNFLASSSYCIVSVLIYAASGAVRGSHGVDFKLC
jgi:hypothetical protein